MGFKKPHGEEKRLRGHRAQNISCGWDNDIRVVCLYFDDAVKADNTRFLCDVLLANQDRVIPSFGKRVDNVMMVIAERKIPGEQDQAYRCCEGTAP